MSSEFDWSNQKEAIRTLDSDWLIQMVAAIDWIGGIRQHSHSVWKHSSPVVIFKV